MRKQGVIAAFFRYRRLNECLENLQSQTDAKLTRSQEWCIKLALALRPRIEGKFRSIKLVSPKQWKRAFSAKWMNKITARYAYKCGKTHDNRALKVQQITTSDYTACGQEACFRTKENLIARAHVLLGQNISHRHTLVRCLSSRLSSIIGRG
jgi:hypothetical protein